MCQTLGYGLALRVSGSSLLSDGRSMLTRERRAHSDGCRREGRNESPGEGGALEGKENTYSQTSNQTVTKMFSILCIAYSSPLSHLTPLNTRSLLGVNLWVLPLWQALHICFLVSTLEHRLRWGLLLAP